ncbi:ABC transporter substrate-binding protein [Rheinheimera sp.]|uniref:ABC transporter substrate-binding protein n=1 Tax=Rheinheimera sp. TaxID=1869214 RepID=UPI00273718C4|nr:ABC transporter substrate-binding protein [Rheinheimera sp.]MDP2713956.1 ABC transporter substrate-binding protein [Rheinheimera sp.]
MKLQRGWISLSGVGRNTSSLLLAGVAALSGCQPDLPETVRSGLVYCSEGSPESFNPQLVTSGTTIDAISQQLYDRLLDIAPDSGELTPGLAQSWQVSADGKTYRFKLRSNVQFHQTEYFTPGRPLNAQDVLFTFNRIMQTGHPFHYQGGGNYPFFQSVAWASLVNKVVAESDDSVRFELSRPDSSFLSNLATDFAAILSAEYAEQLVAANTLSRMDSHPIGTGPFRFKEYQKDVLIRYYRHRNYWREPAKPDQLVFDIVPNNARRMAKLFTHECDVVAFPRVAELKLISQRPDVDVQESTSMNVGFWAFNTRKAPFDNTKVRQALAYAINRDAILQAVYFGHATAANSVLPPTSWAYNPDLPVQQYDPAIAKALLKEAGYPNGFSMDIWAMPVQRLYNPNALKMAELMQADLAQIGVRASIVSYEWNSFRRKLSDNEHDSVLIGWSADNADPDNFFRPLLSCSAADTGTNRANWCDENFDRLIGQALLTADQKQRRSYYLAAQQYLAEQMPLLSIAHSQRFQAISSDIKGVHINPYGGVALAGAVKDIK